MRWLIGLAIVAALTLWPASALAAPSAPTCAAGQQAVPRQEIVFGTVVVTGWRCTGGSSGAPASTGSTTRSSSAPAASVPRVCGEWIATGTEVGVSDWFSPAPCPEGTAARPTRAQVEATVASLTHRLPIPVPTPRIGPDPTGNEWGSAMVGYPLWLWQEGAANTATQASGGGISIAISARLSSVTFTMGDGATLTCTTTTPYPAGTAPGTPSPTCGHVYEQASPALGYTVTAQANWSLAWSALGYQGTLPATTSSTATLRVTELQAVVIPAR